MQWAANSDFEVGPEYFAGPMLVINAGRVTIFTQRNFGAHSQPKGLSFDLNTV